ncbi:MAG: hypothetical protein IKQ93_03995 [Candidatus Methanomethylophilaceae archaeon]|nr:hypothetical protein [Candidatus Methanomethylophilaceae archaeon]
MENLKCGVLVMFFPNRALLDKDMLSIVSGYDTKTVLCIFYGRHDALQNSLVSELERMRRKCFPSVPCGPNDLDVFEYVKNAIAASGDVIIDITYASPFHAASMMNLGGTDAVRIFCTKPAYPGAPTYTRIDRTRHLYNGLTESEYIVLECLSTKAQPTSEIKMEAEFKVKNGGYKLKSIGKSSIYGALDHLVYLGLIDWCEGERPEGYKFRNLNYYRFNRDQKWDYDSFCRNEAARISNRKKADRHKAEDTDRRLGPDRKTRSGRDRSKPASSDKGE